MGKRTIYKKLNIAAWTMNVLAVLALIFVEIIAYKYISYRDYMLLDYIPQKRIIIYEAIIIVIVLIPFFLKRGKKRLIASIVLSSILTAALLAVGVLAILNDAKIKDFIDKTDKTIEDIVENSKHSTDEYGVYVLKTDEAEKLEDIVTYKVGYNTVYSADDVKTAISEIEDKLGAELNSASYGDPAMLAESLLKGDTRAIILNQSLIDLIEAIDDETDDDKANGEFANFTKKIRCIYTVNVKNVMKKDEKVEEDLSEKCFTVYLSGIDTEGSVTTKSRSDVNIIMSVNPVTEQIVLITTPRDYYVPLSISNGVPDKLTHAGIYGIDVSMDTLEMIYDIKLDYFVRLNFTGFINIVDALGGIDVESDYDFYTHGYSYSAGLNKNLSGIEALWFARERHAFAAGDQQRGKDQMEVIRAIITKCQSSALLNNYNEILSNISECFQTNMNKDTIKKLVKFQLNKSPDWRIVTFSAGGYGTSNTTYSMPSARSYVLVPDENSIAQLKQILKDNQDGRIIEETSENEENSNNEDTLQ